MKCENFLCDKVRNSEQLQKSASE